MLKEPLGFFRQLRDQLQADRDSQPDALKRLADASVDLAATTAEIGDISDAIGVYLEAILLGRLARENPGVDEFEVDRAASYNNLGQLLARTVRSC